MDEVPKDKDESCPWKHQGVTYVMDRALADPPTADEPRYDCGYETAFARGIEQLVRHVSQHGIPSDDEIDEDADFLLARTRYSRDYWDRHEHRSSQYVAEILKSIY